MTTQNNSAPPVLGSEMLHIFALLRVVSSYMLAG